MAQIDYFLKIADVEGESTDAKHKGEIELESFSWGEAHSTGAAPGGGAVVGKVQHQDFHFVKKLDKSSPLLMIGCATGQQFKSAVLSGRKAGGGQQDYLRITIDDVLISSYHVGGSAHTDALPMDQVSLNFAKLEMSYKEQKPDGSLGPELKQKYDFAANKKL